MSAGLTIRKVTHTIKPDRAKTYFDDNNLLDWRDRRSGAELAPGTRIAVLVTVQRDERNRPYLVTTDAECSADAFVPLELAPQDAQALTRYAGVTVAVIVTIRRYLAQQFCHGKRYEVEPQLELASLPLNPSPEELASMALQSPVGIQGRFVRYHERTPGLLKSQTCGYLVIDTGTRLVTIGCQRLSRDWWPVYQSGEIENVKDQPLIFGETVRLTAAVAPRGTLDAGYNRAHLVTPDPQRLAAYRTLRRSIAPQLRQLASHVTLGRHQQARSLFAHLRRLKQTKAETHLAVQLVNQLPPHARPIFGQLYTAIELESHYGINVERLNRAQFLLLAYRAVQAEHPSTIEVGDLRNDFLYYLDSPAFTKTEAFGLISAALTSSLRRLELHVGEQSISSRKDLSLLKQCLSVLGSEVKTAEAIAKLVEVANHCLAHGYVSLNRDAEGADTCPWQFRDILDKTFEALTHARREAASATAALTPALIASWQQQLAHPDVHWLTKHELKNLAPLI